jgi:hypothetical protein
MERVVENWLTNASERSYQTSFCHLLNCMGYAVVHSTSHGPAEEGKDVIAVGNRGRIMAFQLKRGNVSVPVWRDIQGEIQELTELPIRHPSIPRGSRHCPVLVTNGYINEHVLNRIDKMNEQLSFRGFRPLETWAGSQLLMDFKRQTHGVLPEEMIDVHRLLGFMISRGDEPLDKGEFDLLLKSVLPLSPTGREPSKATASQHIRTSAVVAEYALAPADRRMNSFAKIEAYTMLFCYIRALVLRTRVRPTAWRPTVSLIEEALDGAVLQLFEEARTQDDFGQGDPMSNLVVSPYRKALVAGALAAHGLWCMLGGGTRWAKERSQEMVEQVLRCSQGAALPSEGFVPAQFLASEFLRYSGHIGTANAIFKSLLIHSILRKQPGKKFKPLWSPYVPLEEAVLRDLGKEPDHIISESGQIESYTGYPLVLLAAARFLKQDLRDLWYAITSLDFCQYASEHKWQMLLWDNKQTGTLLEKIVPQPQKWGSLLVCWFSGNWTTACGQPNGWFAGLTLAL